MREDPGWRLFDRPIRVLRADQPQDVVGTIDAAERLARSTGCTAVGFVAYEAAAAFGLSVHEARAGIPLVWFGLFEPARGRWVEDLVPHDYTIGPSSPSVNRETFLRAFRSIKRHLADGESYQVNYTFKLSASFGGDARGLFTDLAAAQGGRHAAFIDIGTHVVCSASPELFFERVGERVSARPMKGTAGRGLTVVEDRCARDALSRSSKQRAENVMIVDMVRNDLGRVADVGSVEVPELFTTERYPNVWQMTSLVTARCSTSLARLFSVMHPSASVTGAPKVRTMEILRKLETEPRGIYTGAIGRIDCNGAARFNVAIRTAVVDRTRGRVDFGVGSGIVWDSDVSDEYDECLLKGTVLGQRPSAFSLLETMRWTPADGFFLLDRHLRRLVRAAEYFGFPCSEADVRAILADALAGAQGLQRVRLLVNQVGEVRVERAPLDASCGLLRVTLAQTPIDASNPFLYHKTTNRLAYDGATRPGYDDAILWNEAGQVTEATRANVVVELAGRRCTPPVHSGLLAGVYREELLATGAIVERIVTQADLAAAERVWLISALRGWTRAVLET